MNKSKVKKNIEVILNHFIIISSCILNMISLKYAMKEGYNFCWFTALERGCALGMSLALFINTKYGYRVIHYAFAILFSLIGGSLSLYQAYKFICPQYFSPYQPICGLHIYSWALMFFSFYFLLIAFSVFLHTGPHKRRKKPKAFEKGLIFILIITTLSQFNYLIF